MARIWIVEDDPKIGLLIEMTMKKAGHETLCLLDDVELARALKKQEHQPELLLLDLMLRAKSGFDILREWKADHQTRGIPVIIISARSSEQDKVRGLEFGAEDYITKPFGVRELQARVHTALRRLPQAPEAITVGALTLSIPSRETYVNGTRIELTAKEYDLLLYLAQHAGAAVTRGELLKEVWGFANEDDPSRTVDSHVKTLRLKLGDSPDRPRFIQTVRGTGYRLITGEDV
ncbi:MAG: response regulator transcription factor [Selenomonadaceae bacterium]|nr:response regulator transcription factor [Selenomonadaceae bacterium]